MNYSRRLKWESRPNAISVAKAEAQAAGRPLLDLTISNPTRAGISYPPDLLDALSDRRSLRHEPDAFGLLAAREAVAEYYAAQGASVHPDQVVLTASTSEAYHYLFKLLADPGEEILTPRPSYPLFDFLAGLELLDTVPYSTDLADPCNLATDRTRALVTVHPNNPTGTYLSPPQSQQLASRCAGLGITLIADEVFLDYPLGEARASTLAHLETGNVCVLSGLSKVCGLPQMKMGWIVLAGETPVGMRERLELIADTYLSVSAPVQWASLEWLRRRAEIQAPILERIRANSLRLQQLTKGTAIRYVPPEGGWAAVLALPGTVDEEVLVLRLIQDSGILLQPGYYYDFDRNPRLVVSLLTPPSDLETGMSEVKAAV